MTIDPSGATTGGTLLRASDRARQPWLNGGGVTWPVASFPPGSDMHDFDWRLSVAEVTQAGPFSIFPDVDRTIATLAGTLELDVEGRSPISLSDRDAAYDFPGDVRVSGRPAGLKAVDLNLMVRRGTAAARMRRVAQGAHSLEAGCHILFACRELAVDIGGQRFELGRHDARHIATERPIEMLLGDEAILVDLHPFPLVAA